MGLTPERHEGQPSNNGARRLKIRPVIDRFLRDPRLQFSDVQKSLLERFRDEEELTLQEVLVVRKLIRRITLFYSTPTPVEITPPPPVELALPIPVEEPLLNRWLGRFKRIRSAVAAALF